LVRPSRALISPLLFSVLLFALQASAQTQPDAKASPIEQGAVVHLEYTVMDDKGNVIESHKGKDPLVYTQGRRQIVRGVEKAVVGMRRGETKRVTVAKTVILDFNHPLAGKTLNFDIKVLSVAPAKTN